MKFLLVVILLAINPRGGEIVEFTPMTKAFETLEECNAAGRYLAKEVEHTQEGVQSVSFCVTPEDYAPKA